MDLLEEEELKIIGELATKYDAVVMEDQAYFCMTSVILSVVRIRLLLCLR